MKNTVKLFTLIIFSLFVSACSPKLKQTVGLSTPGPNEYSVTKNKSLEIPPHFNLQEVERLKGGNSARSDNSGLNSGEKALLEASTNR